MVEREQRLREIRDRQGNGSETDHMDWYDIDVKWLLAEIERLETAHRVIDDFATETFIVEEFGGEEYVSLGYHHRFIQRLEKVLGR